MNILSLYKISRKFEDAELEKGPKIRQAVRVLNFKLICFKLLDELCSGSYLLHAA